mmetsp:Transcript_18962/g.48347  ORF Transcript_18962/g.48347 Transcript_18962/m.48347 type:complete len:127 (-) Transcript_18962:78-458(-)
MGTVEAPFSLYLSVPYLFFPCFSPQLDSSSPFLRRNEGRAVTSASVVLVAQLSRASYLSTSRFRAFCYLQPALIWAWDRREERERGGGGGEREREKEKERRTGMQKGGKWKLSSVLSVGLAAQWLI